MLGDNMWWLFVVSLVWAFSFGLIKGRLTGLDPTGVALVRLGLAWVVFLPFLKWGALSVRSGVWLGGVGAVQFGAMYLMYLQAFQHLMAFEVALFTVFTPLYVALLDGALENRLNGRHLAAAGLSVVGAALVLGTGFGSETAMVGFLWVQGSNLCFAAGQVAYKRTRGAFKGVSDAGLFGWLYLGAVVMAGSVGAWSVDWAAFRPTGEQWGVLVYLGVLASGVGFFWWNLGATRVNTGVLAAFNNAKIPLGIAVSLVVFGESADFMRLGLSLGLLAVAIAVANRAGGGRE